MALPPLKVKVTVDDREFVAGLARIKARVRKLGADFRRMGRQVSTFVTAPIVALAAVTARLANTQIQAERTLATVLKLSGDAVEQRLEGFKAFASALQEITIVGDEVTLKNIQVAKSMGLTDNQAKRAARNAIALSAAFGINAKSAIRYTAALEEGDTEMLNRYIPTLRLIKDSTLRAAAAQKILEGAFEAAVSAAKEGLGPFRQMLNDLGDLGEEFGSLIIPGVTAFAGKIREVIAVIRDLEPIQKKWLVGLAAAVAASGPILIGLGLLAAAIGAILSPVGLVVAAIAGVAGLVAWLVLTSDSSTKLERATDNVVIAMGDEILQTQQLSAVLQTNNTMTVEAAKKNLALAKARLEDVVAIIAQIRATALASDELARIDVRLRRNRAQLIGEDLILPFDPELDRRRQVFRNNIQDLLIEKRALLAADQRLLDQERDTAAQIAFLNAAIADQVNGLIRLGGVLIEPIESTERLGQVATATTTELAIEAEALDNVAEAAFETERRIDSVAHQMGRAVLEVRNLDDALHSLQRILSNVLADITGSFLSDVFKTGLTAAGAAFSNLFANTGAPGGAGIGTSGAAGSAPSQDLVRFAHGGSFTVGGRGGVDRNLVAFRATRGERVDITPAGGGRGGVTIKIINNTPMRTREERETGPNGEVIRKFIIDEVKKGFGQGEFTSEMRNFGVGPTAVLR